MIGSFARQAVLIGCVSATSLAQVQSVQVAGDQVTHRSLDATRVGDHVRIENFAIPNDRLDLELERIEVLGENAQLIVGTADGQRALPRPDVVILSGIVAGDPDSQAYLAVSPYATNGFVARDGRIVSISTGSWEQDKDLQRALRAAWMSDLIDPNAVVRECGYTQGDANLEPSGPPIEYPPSAARGAASTCRIASIAVETDYEFTDRLFNGNTNASAAYLVSLVGAISEIYERDVNVRLNIPFLRVWADNADPYNTSSDPLDQVLAHWNANMTDVQRTVTHYFTGRQNTSYGGIAYVGVLCNEDYGYGVSAHLEGSFPYPLADFHGGNWDVVVAAHELGHNFGTGHTHSYSPPIDGCGNGDCSDPFPGTIMSYCHTCSGGLGNIALEFHPRVRDTVVGYMDSIGCDLMGEGVTAADDTVEALQDTPIDIDVLANDLAQSCDPFTLDSFDPSSLGGGTVELLAGQGPNGRDLLRYTPAAGYSNLDSFAYSIAGATGSSTGAVNIDVRALRPADNRLNPIPGLHVGYYALSSPSVLPDFDALEPYATEVADNVDFASTNGDFMGSGRGDEVGALLEGYVWALVDGIYTFSTNSDDGSRLYIGDELVVNNDGLHGMERRTGTIPLSAGWHQVRIEFFENGGGAGLISTIAGPGMGEQPLTGLLLSHEDQSQCSPADLNADGAINFFDVSAYLDLFNAQDPAADFTGDGAINFFDVSAFLQAFNAGCP